MNTGLITIVAALGGALAGCAGVPTVTRVDQTTFYSPDDVRAAAVGGLATTVYGPADAAQLAPTIITGVQLPSWIGNAPLRLTRGDDPDLPSKRLVLVVNPAGYSNYDQFCRSPASIPTEAVGPLTIAAVMCQGDEHFARGFLAQPDLTIGGPGYADAMTDMLAVMLPSGNPERDRDNQPDGSVRVPSTG